MRTLWAKSAEATAKICWQTIFYEMVVGEVVPSLTSHRDISGKLGID